MRTPEILLHPASIKYLLAGHPWITRDTYTRKIPKDATFFIGVDQHKKKLGLFIHDTQHNKVAGRLWDQKQFQTDHFFKQVQERLAFAVEKRRQLKLSEQRENYYLVFGEADQLPGILILQMGPYLVVQFYAFFWERWKQALIDELKKLKLMTPVQGAWIHYRGADAKKEYVSFQKDSSTPTQITVREFGLDFQVRLNQYYDIGLYTDMAAIRKQLQPYSAQAKSLLNLYAYTGAFSLMGLNYKMQVSSVDLSKKYMSWLEENIKLNPQLIESHHQSIVAPVDQALQKMIGEQQKFDLIICDPPSASSDGQKMQTAFSQYQKTIVALNKLLRPQGHMVLFLNTHSIGSKKFKLQVQQTLKEAKLDRTLKLVAELGLNEDCATLPNFPEGQYLKGLVLKQS